MKVILLGIAIILFGIALILCSAGNGGIAGLGISFAGLIVSAAGAFKPNGRGNLKK